MKWSVLVPACIFGSLSVQYLFYHDQRRYRFVLYYVGVAKALANRRNGLPSIGLRHNLDRSHKGLLMSGGTTVLIPAVI